MASLSTKIKLYLAANSVDSVDFTSDVLLQGDSNGQGPYIKEWNISGVSKPTDEQLAVSIRKNGSNICSIENNWNASGGNAMASHVGVTVDMNGSSDYVEAYCYQNTASGNSSTVYASQANSSFGGYRVGT